MRRRNSRRRRGRAAMVWGLLLFAAVSLAVMQVGRERVRSRDADAAQATADLTPDAAMAPLESAEGAVGLVSRQNAGAAVNPITPTGALGGPAGQTPAWSEPGGAPSRVVGR